VSSLAMASLPSATTASASARRSIGLSAEFGFRSAPDSESDGFTSAIKPQRSLVVNLANLWRTFGLP
jgi:hypothetical protein